MPSTWLSASASRKSRSATWGVCAIPGKPTSSTSATSSAGASACRRSCWRARRVCCISAQGRCCSAVGWSRRKPGCSAWGTSCHCHRPSATRACSPTGRRCAAPSTCCRGTLRAPSSIAGPHLRNWERAIGSPCCFAIPAWRISLPSTVNRGGQGRSCRTAWNWPGGSSTWTAKSCSASKSSA
ncbi:hypothetical protein D3C80_1450480 [compost metagenome]